MRNRIRELRKEWGMNQEMLASLIGVSQQTVSKIERDMESISIDLLIRLAEYFHVTTDYILGLSEDKRGTAPDAKQAKRLEAYYQLIMEYERLDAHNQQVCMVILPALRAMQDREDNKER